MPPKSWRRVPNTFESKWNWRQRQKDTWVLWKDLLPAKWNMLKARRWWTPLRSQWSAWDRCLWVAWGRLTRTHDPVGMLLQGTTQLSQHLEHNPSRSERYVDPAPKSAQTLFCFIDRNASCWEGLEVTENTALDARSWSTLDQKMFPC